MSYKGLRSICCNAGVDIALGGPQLKYSEVGFICEKCGQKCDRVSGKIHLEGNGKIKVSIGK